MEAAAFLFVTFRCEVWVGSAVGCAYHLYRSDTFAARIIRSQNTRSSSKYSKLYGQLDCTNLNAIVWNNKCECKRKCSLISILSLSRTASNLVRCQDTFWTYSKNDWNIIGYEQCRANAGAQSLALTPAQTLCLSLSLSISVVASIHARRPGRPTSWHCLPADAHRMRRTTIGRANVR